MVWFTTFIMVQNKKDFCQQRPEKTYKGATSYIGDENNIVFRDYNITFDIVCYNDAWVLDDYKIRPLAICGYIDGILNSISQRENLYKRQIKLTGIGQYQFLACNEQVLNEDLSMYTLAYRGIHFTEDLNKVGQVSIDD